LRIQQIPCCFSKLLGEPFILNAATQNLGERTMDITTSKYLGGVGALLIFIGAIPGIGTYGILAVVGLIIVLTALYGLAGFYKEQGIFNNALYGTFVGIAGVFAIGVVVFFTLVDFLKTVVPGWNGDWITLQNINPADIRANITLSTIQPFIGSFLLALLLLFVIAIVVAFFYRRSFVLVARRTGTGLFGTTGLLILIGAIFTVILLGLILIWVAMLLLAITFFSMRTQPPPMQPAAPA
jgi:uncharacterized membrane protein